MQLSPFTIDWNIAVKFYESGCLIDKLLCDESEPARAGSVPWDYDSVNMYFKTAEKLETSLVKLNHANVINAKLINSDMKILNDLNFEHQNIAGLVSNISAKALFNDLDIFFENELKKVFPDPCDEFLEYFSEWVVLFKYASKNNYGICFHIG
jgi:hypothetical protein